MSREWYKSSYRRNLVDMHIDDWNEEFLSELDVEEYFAYLQDARVDSVMLYLQSHVGLCYYPTRSGKMHNALRGREDIIRRLADKCRASGIAVVGYYSLIFNTYEEDRHPEWRLVKDRESGLSARQMGSRYGHCCPNNAHYRAFVAEQVKEIADYFTLDGMFYDMTYWSGVCYCEDCRKRFEAETGLAELPDMSSLNTSEAMLFLKKRYEWIAEFAEWITCYTHSIIPDITVTHNNAYEVSGDWHEASWEGVSDCSDFCTGDLYGDIYDHSFCMKYFLGATQNMPFEYMVSRFSKDLKQHTLSKTQTALTQDVLLTVAHHGANFVIDAMDPVGTLNRDVARLIGASFSSQLPYEKYLDGEIIADVAVWYSTTGRYNTEGRDFDSRSASCALAKIFNLAHVPFAVSANTASRELGKYKMVFAPAIAGLEKKHLSDIREYVEGGGTFYFSGVEQPELLDMFFGARCTGYSGSKYTYIAPKSDCGELFAGFSRKYPLAMCSNHPTVEVSAKGTEVMATLTLPYGSSEMPMCFASIHSNPPGVHTKYPSLMSIKVGEGRVIWSALPIEQESESYHHRRVMISLLDKYLPRERRSLLCGAPSQVEAVSFEEKDGVLVSFIDMGVGEDRLHLPAFEVSLAVAKEPRAVCLLPSETEVEFKYRNGRVIFRTRELDMFDMYKIQL